MYTPACYRGPSRIFWFVLGAGTATWWIKHEEMQHPTWGHCRRPAIQNFSGGGHHHPPGANSPVIADSSFSFKDIPRTINNLPPSNEGWNWGWGEKEREREGEREWQQDQLADFRRQAVETMSDLTEATLESILTAAGALTAKLAESRARRKKYNEELFKQVEEQSKSKH